MRDKVLELLSRHNIASGAITLSAISLGASGAHVFSIDGKYVAKYAHLPSLDSAIRESFEREYAFYECCSKKGIDFVPEVVFQDRDCDGLLIVLRKYAPIEIGEWNEALQLRAMEVCAKINALDVDGFLRMPDAGPRENDAPYPLSSSFDNWKRLHDRFPGQISLPLLEELHRDFSAVEEAAKGLSVPDTPCHGDFHPGNFLKDDGRLLICDWQNASVGRGIGDVAFFISRGKDMGLAIDRDKLIRGYHESLLKYADKRVAIDDLYSNIAASEFLVSFRYWAQYLQESGPDRVLGVYDSMIRCYRAVRERY